MRAGEWLKMAEARLAAAGVDSPRLDAQLLVAHLLGKDRSWVLSHPEVEVPELAAEGLLQRRESREPLPYITGEREFYGHKFWVDSRVLIPRWETELLVSLIEASTSRGASVLDLGTGSGAIAISLALARPDLRVTGSDISPGALRVAQKNAERLWTRVRLEKGDLFAPFENESFDWLVCNPPYIGRDEPLMPEVAEHEPSLALFADDHGLAIYRRIAKEGVGRITEGAMFEVGYRQARDVQAIFESEGWHFVQSFEDLDGTERILDFSPPGLRREP